MEIMVIGMAVFGGLCAAIASGKNRNVILWALLGALAGILAFLVLVCLPKGINGLKRCNHCAEHVERDAKVCKHCGSDF